MKRLTYLQRLGEKAKGGRHEADIRWEKGMGQV